jgi:hypothetical protein
MAKETEMSELLFSVTARRMGKEQQIKDAVEAEMHPLKLTVEGKDSDGNWIQI